MPRSVSSTSARYCRSRASRWSGRWRRSCRATSPFPPPSTPAPARLSRRRASCGGCLIAMRATPGAWVDSSNSAAGFETERDGACRLRRRLMTGREIMDRVASLTAAMLFCAIAAPAHLTAAEIKVFSPGSTEGAFSELIPQFEKSSGHKVTIQYGPVGALAARVAKGETVDVAILSEPATADLLERGKLVAGSEIVVA